MSLAVAADESHQEIKDGLGQPANFLSRLRLLFLVFVFVGVLGLPQLLLGSQMTTESREVALGGAAWLMASAVWLYHHNRPNVVVDLLDSFALLCTGIALGSFEGLTAFLYPILFYTSLYGGRRRVAIRTLLWVGVLTAFMLNTHDGGQLPGQIPSIVIIAFVMHLLARTLAHQRQTMAYQQALATAGTRLVAAQTHEEIYEAAISSAGVLALQEPDLVACLSFPVGSNEVEFALARGCRAQSLIGQRFPLGSRDLSPPSYRVQIDSNGFRDALVAPLVINEKLVGLLILASQSELPRGMTSSLESIAAQTMLSLERLLANERFRSLVHHSTDVITVVAADRRVRYQSPSFSRLTGTLADKTVGGRVHELLHPEDRAVLEAALSDEAAVSHRVHLRWHHRDGGWRTTETIVSNLVDDTSVQGWVLNTRDVTERVALEMELRHSQKLEAVGRLAAGIAHEINTPIQFIGDNLSFVSDSFDSLGSLLSQYRSALYDENSPRNWDELRFALQEFEAGIELEFLQAEVPEAVNQALDGVRRVSSIVSAMKAFGHPDRAEQQYANLNEALGSTIIVARSEFKYVADEQTDFGDIPLVSCFKGDLNQVFLNLLVNAAHAIADRTHEGGRGIISVRTWQDGDDVLISIGDTGAGIPEEIRTRIFDPFFTTKEVGRGTGQGLSLVQAVVVERHGGTVAYETELGVGTTFTIRLPIGGLTCQQSVVV